jgi:hypothetical protein
MPGASPGSGSQRLGGDLIYIALGQVSMPRPADCIRADAMKSERVAETGGVGGAKAAGNASRSWRLRTQLLMRLPTTVSCIRSTLHPISILTEALRLPDRVFPQLEAELTPRHMAGRPRRRSKVVSCEATNRRAQHLDRDAIAGKSRRRARTRPALHPR